MAEENMSDYPQFRDYPGFEIEAVRSQDNWGAVLAIVLGGLIAGPAIYGFVNLFITNAISTQKAAVFCVAIIAGSGIICVALIKVFSREASERKMRFNWYKDQLDDYLARKDRQTDSAGVK